MTTAMDNGDTNIVQGATFSNQALINRLLRLCEANIQSGHRVTEINHASTGRYELTTEDTTNPHAPSQDEATELYSIIVAAPLLIAKLTVLGNPSAEASFVERHVTHFLMSWGLSKPLFGLKNSGRLPSKVLTTADSYQFMTPYISLEAMGGSR